MSKIEAVQNEDQPILSLIQKIKTGALKPENLSIEMRQQCVEVLYIEGWTINEIAQILCKCDRTIRRDLDEIREKRALTPGIDLAKQIIGEMVMKSRANQARLKKISREKASVSERAQAIYYAHRIEMDVVARLQTLGYLPLKPHEIVADVSHRVTIDDEKSFEELRDQIGELERISEENKELSPEVSGELERLKRRIEKAEIQNNVVRISSKQETGGRDE